MRLIDADAYAKRLSELAKNAENNAMPMTAAQFKWTADDMMKNAPTIDDWIRVEDKLPEQTGCYQVYRPNFWGEYGGQTCVCYWDGKYWCDSYEGAGADGFELSPGDVSHWMPLPEPPKEEDT